MNNEKIAIILFSVLGSIIVVDTFFFWVNIGTQQNNVTLGYCIGFIFVSSAYPSLTKNKYVMIPFYILIGQMLFSISFK